MIKENHLLFWRENELTILDNSHMESLVNESVTKLNEPTGMDFSSIHALNPSMVERASLAEYGAQISLNSSFKVAANDIDSSSPLQLVTNNNREEILEAHGHNIERQKLDFHHHLERAECETNKGLDSSSKIAVFIQVHLLSRIR